MTAPWARALHYALTGHDRPSPNGDRPDVEAAVVAARGGGAIEMARERRAAGQPWPLPLPEELRASLPSMAQFAAALQAAVEELDVSEHETRRDRRPDADERRLLADRPPHFGSVG